VFLWFGSWKNGKSTYQPLWIKTNQARFPLIQNELGKSLPTMTTLNEANRESRHGDAPTPIRGAFRQATALCR
jgi:hypothetical protein